MQIPLGAPISAYFLCDNRPACAEPLHSSSSSTAFPWLPESVACVFAALQRLHTTHNVCHFSMRVCMHACITCAFQRSHHLLSVIICPRFAIYLSSACMHTGLVSNQGMLTSATPQHFHHKTYPSDVWRGFKASFVHRRRSRFIKKRTHQMAHNQRIANGLHL